MDETQSAVGGLEQLGLTEYEARCFVALTRIPHGTAKEVAQVADVPRSRVYETMERLQNRGLVEIEEGEPRSFQAVPVDTAVRVLRKEYDSYFEQVEGSLRQLTPALKETQQAVWAINDHEQVTERVIDLVGRATDELLLIVLHEDLVDREVLAYLAEASERGVRIHVGTTVESVRRRVSDAGIDARFFTTGLIEWLDSRRDPPLIGQMLMIDRGPVLVSAVHEEQLPGVMKETAVWSDGIDHGFANFAERVLTYELKGEMGDEYEKTGGG